MKIKVSIIATSKRRARDYIARYDGEEFFILLPFTDLKGGAKQMAQELTQNVQNLSIQSA